MTSAEEHRSVQNVRAALGTLGVTGEVHHIPDGARTAAEAAADTIAIEAFDLGFKPAAVSVPAAGSGMIWPRSSSVAVRSVGSYAGVVQSFGSNGWPS